MSFCPEAESTQHLLFNCTMVKYVWSLIALVIGANCHPCSFEQYWTWVQTHLPGVRNFIWWGWQLYAGLCGKQGTTYALITRKSDLLLRSYAQLVPLFLFGQNSNTKRTGEHWRKELTSSRPRRSIFTHSRRLQVMLGRCSSNERRQSLEQRSGCSFMQVANRGRIPFESVVFFLVFAGVCLQAIAQRCLFSFGHNGLA